MAGAFIYGKRQVFANHPSFFHQAVAQSFDLRDADLGPGVFLSAHIEPDFLADFVAHLAHIFQNGGVGPPDGRRHDEQLAKNLRMLQTEIETDQSAERRAADAGVDCVRKGSAIAIDERLQFVDDELSVSSRAAAPAPFVFDVRILGHALHTGVVNADDDERLNFISADEALCRLIQAPLVAKESCRAIEEILPVVHVEHGITGSGRRPVIRRQIDNHVARGFQKARLKALNMLKMPS